MFGLVSSGTICRAPVWYLTNLIDSHFIFVETAVSGLIVDLSLDVRDSSWI